MKRWKTVFVGGMLLAAAALAACGKQEAGGEGENIVLAGEEIGTMLSLEAMEESHKAIVNDAGMNGTAGRIHLHSALEGDMARGSSQIFQFDIGHTERLGKLYVWNYNESDNTDCGLKEVKISVSEDNVNFSEPVSYTLAQANGQDGLEATNLADGSVIDFQGVCGRYIRIEADSNYGGSEYGLSELRLFRYKQQITEGNMISASPLERYINGKWSAKEQDYNIVNGSGLSGTTADATHDNLAEHMVTQKATAFDFVIDLKGQYPVSKVVLWNYNDAAHLDYGLKKFKLKISDDCTTWKTLGTYTLPQAGGEAELSPSLTIELDNVTGHYLQIEIIDNYGGEMTGLSEVSAFLGSGWYCDAESDYTALLSNYHGWAGADGIYTVNLNGRDYDYDKASEEQKTFFIFSDTILSEVDPVTKLRSQVTMVNNTSALLKGKTADIKNMEFYIPEAEEKNANIVTNGTIPATKPGKSIYYWLGDTFVVGDKLYVFCLRIDSVHTVFGFEQIGVDLARYDIKEGAVDMDSVTVIDDEEMRLCNVTNSKSRWYFGGAVYESTEAAGVLNPDGFLYIYGYHDVDNQGRMLVVSRVVPELVEDFSAYEYLSADGTWSASAPEEFMHLAEDVAPECSVTQLQSGADKGKFLFVNTHLTNSTTIMASVSNQPYEPFEQKTIIYNHDVCLTTVGEGNNSYNAKVHPALSNENEIILSFNVNGNDCFRYADIYRPRFLRLAMVAEKGSK